MIKWVFSIPNAYGNRFPKATLLIQEYRYIRQESQSNAMIVIKQRAREVMLRGCPRFEALCQAARTDFHLYATLKLIDLQNLPSQSRN